MVSIAGLVASRITGNRSSIAEESAPPAFRVFWRGFTSGPDAPWVIFSNGAFVGRPETGLRYFNPAHDARDAILDHYTGVGEVLAVYDLDEVFSRFHRQLRVKRGSLFTLDDAQNNNLIFVGSPAENLSLLDIPSTHQFVFQRSTSGPRKGDLAVVNVHPRPDEPKMFFASESRTPLTEDYGIVALVPGMNSARSVLILAGTTTIGTQAAAEYVCRQDSLEQLLLRLSVPAGENSTLVSSHIGWRGSFIACHTSPGVSITSVSAATSYLGISRYSLSLIPAFANRGYLERADL